MFDMIPMADMAKTPAEVAEEKDELIPTNYITNKYPYGLCISLDEESLAKLQMPLNADVGDGVQIMGIGRVTSVTKNELADGTCKCRVEIQITHLALDGGEPEDEGDEA